MKVLHILNGLNVGGAEAFLKNLNECLKQDDVQMDFLLRSQNNDIETVRFFRQRGSEITIVPSFPKNILKNRKETYRFLEKNKNKYDVIHIHANSLIYYYPIAVASKICKKAILIIHSHSVSTSSKITAFLHYINKKRLQKNDNITLLSCGEKAGNWMFGEKPFIIIPNSINIDKFKNSEQIRNKLRTENKIDSKTLLCVGRLEYQKNQKFLIPIVNELIKIYPDLQLWLCGDGSLKEEIKQSILDNKLQNNIKLLGNRLDVNDLLKMADVYLMPSLYEGFGIAAIEAQATGIPCVFSNNIPEEAIMTNNVSVLPLEMYDWTSKIIELLTENNFLYKNANYIENKGYGLSTLRKTILDAYCK